MKRLIVFCLVLIFGLSLGACSTEDFPQKPTAFEAAEESKPADVALDAYRNILLGKDSFCFAASFYSSTDLERLTIDELKQTVSDDEMVTVEVLRYTLTDLDDCGIPELVLWLKVNNDEYYGFEILRWTDEKTYGYTLWFRQFSNPKTDGTFHFSGGVSDSGTARLEFTENSYSLKRISYTESTSNLSTSVDVIYFVNGESATEAEFVAEMERQEAKLDATWCEFEKGAEPTLSWGEAA